MMDIDKLKKLSGRTDESKNLTRDITIINSENAPVAFAQQIFDFENGVAKDLSAINDAFRMALSGVQSDVSKLDTSIFKIVTELPETGLPDKIYLVPASLDDTSADPLGESKLTVGSTVLEPSLDDTTTTHASYDNHYTEYLYANNLWEKIGEYKPDVDLSNYVQLEDLALYAQISDLSNFVLLRNVDTELSTDSGNPVENRVVTKAINNLEGRTTNLEGRVTNIETDLYGIDANVGDAVFYNKTTKQFVTCAKEDIKYDENLTPIGVVAIPSSHDVYGTGEAGVISLKYMSVKTPDTGADSPEDIYWGGNGTDTSLKNFNQVPIFGTPAAQTDVISDTSSYYGYLPSDALNNAVSNVDPLAKYYQRSGKAIPSPYLADGSRNPNYFMTEGLENNALSDFDGVGNTQVLTNLITVGNWKTANTIANSSSDGNYPAAACCWRYSTEGTTQGDWYLPAAGELGYVAVRKNAINDTITALNTAYGVVGSILSTDNYYWSSSEYNYDLAYLVVFNQGGVGTLNKYEKHYARAFLRLNLTKPGKFVTKDELQSSLAGVDLSEYAKKATVDAILKDAPESMDTFKEVSDAIDNINTILIGLYTTLTVSGGKTFEKNVETPVTISWSLAYNKKAVTPDKVTLNGTETTDSSFSETITDTKTYTVVATYKGINFTANATCKGIYPVYYGVSADGTNLTKKVSESVYGTYSGDAVDGLNFWIKTPYVSTFRWDSGGFDVPFELTTETLNGTTYNVFSMSAPFNTERAKTYKFNISKLN